MDDDVGGRSEAAADPAETSLAESSSERFNLSLALLYELEMSDSLCWVFLFVSAQTPETGKKILKYFLSALRLGLPIWSADARPPHLTLHGV